MAKNCYAEAFCSKCKKLLARTPVLSKQELVKGWSLWILSVAGNNTCTCEGCDKIPNGNITIKLFRKGKEVSLDELEKWAKFH